MTNIPKGTTVVLPTKRGNYLHFFYDPDSGLICIDLEGCMGIGKVEISKTTLDEDSIFECKCLPTNLEVMQEIKANDIWSEFPLYPVHDWRLEVQGGVTRSGYWDWVESLIESNG